MHALDAEGQRLLAYLVNHLRSAVPGEPQTYVSYKRVHGDIGLTMRGTTFGMSLQHQGLDALAVWARDTGLPAITGLVIREDSYEPAEGYRTLLGKPADFYPRWKDEIARSKSMDWSPYLVGVEQVPSELPVEAAAANAVTVIGVSSKGAVPGTASVWRLIAHHEKESAEEAAEEMVRRGVIAIGWSNTGDLNALMPASSEFIGARIRQTHPEAGNSQTGGPSLWRLWSEVVVGDLVIIAARGRKFVVEVTGDYAYTTDDVMGYRHQRSAALTDIDPDVLWHASGAGAAEGDNTRWTLMRLSTGGDAAKLAYEEGERYEVRSTAVERNPRARQACIDHHKAQCFVCGFDFSTRYGAIGKDYIHVHHRRPLAQSNGPYRLDPVKDLVPLCPNCHAMVHRYHDPADVEGFKATYWVE